MQLSDVTHVLEARSAEEADDFIGQGWTLVAIVAGNRYCSGTPQIGPIYVLGKHAAVPVANARPQVTAHG